MTIQRPVAVLRFVNRFSEEEKEKGNNQDRTERVVFFPPLPPAGAANCQFSKKGEEADAQGRTQRFCRLPFFVLAFCFFLKKLGSAAVNRW